MTKSCKQLPEGWVLHDTIDLKNNKKQFWAVQGLAAVLMIVMFAIGWLIQDPFKLYEPDIPLWEYYAALAVMAVGFIAYIVLHELTHGVFLSAFTKTKPKFGFVGWAAYCGNEAYCNKPCYAVVALAPLVIWGIIFGVLNVFFHSGVWFWTIWILQTGNVSGACGDIFVSCKLLKYPKEILVQDTGLSMRVYRYSPEEYAAAQAETKGEETTEEERKDV